MSINASLQQISGGAAAAFAGLIIKQADKSSPLEHYDTVGYIMVAVSAVSIILMYRVSQLVKMKLQEKKV
jgi:hypothetical protein